MDVISELPKDSCNGRCDTSQTIYTQQELVDILVPIFRRYPIKRAGLFGSYARGDQTAESDLDIILELHSAKGQPCFIFELWDVLEDAVKLKTDIVTVCALRVAPTSFRERVLKESMYIYEE